MPLEGLSKDDQRFYDVLIKESEFVQIVVAAAYLDACLGAMLKQFLADSSLTSELLDARPGPLGTFATRSKLCYCLGLTGKAIYQDLQTILEIRNTIAHHHLALDFSHAEVEHLCRKLTMANAIRDPSGMSPRNQFVITVVLLAQRLLVDGLGLTHREVRP